MSKSYTVAIAKRIEAHELALQIAQQERVNGKDQYHQSNNANAAALSAPNIPTYYMSREIIRVIEDAADGIPDSFSLLPDDCPTPSGFMYLDGGIEQPDWLGSGTLSKRMFLGSSRPWDDTEDGSLPEWVAFAWNHRKDVQNQNRGGLHIMDFMGLSRSRTKTSSWANTGTPAVVDTLHWPWGTSLTDKAQQSAQIQVYGDEPGQQDGNLVSPEDAELMRIMFDRLLRLYATMFVFMRQKILVATPHRPDRAERRRAERRGEVLEDVHVIRLRGREAAVSASEATHTTEWARRWIVRGHWRNQWYPSLNMHQPKWIGPYIKGPDGKPLIEPQKLFAVVD